MEPLAVVQGDETVPQPEVHSASEDSIEDQGVAQNNEIIALDDIVLSDDTVQGIGEPTSQGDEMGGSDAEHLTTERKETSSRAEEGEGDAEMGSTEGEEHADNGPVMTDEAELEPGEGRSDDEDEGIGLDGEELDDIGRQETEEELNQGGATAALEQGNYIYHMSILLIKHLDFFFPLSNRSLSGFKTRQCDWIQISEP